MAGTIKILNPDRDERGIAVRAHMSAWLNILPLTGVFISITIYAQNQRKSPWASQQALQSAFFQFISFNVLIAILVLVLSIAVLLFYPESNSNSLLIKLTLVALPFVVGTYLIQGLLATRAARVVYLGQNFRYPILGRLIGPPAPTAKQVFENLADVRKSDN